MLQTSILEGPKFDYVSRSNPTASVNPNTIYATWMNILTGELFICIDATAGKNIWSGQFGTLIPDYSSTVIADTPVNYWRMNDLAILTDTYNLYDMALVGSAPEYEVPALIHDIHSKGIRFSGSTYFKKSTSVYRSSDQVGSIEGWVNLTGSEDGGALFSSADTGSSNYGLRFIVDHNRLDMGAKTTSWDNGYFNFPSTIQDDGLWHHVVVTSDGSDWRGYLDGEQLTYTVGGGTNAGRWFADISSRDNLTIGAWDKDIKSEYFNGSISEVAVYDYQLSNAQILTHFNAGRNISA